MYASNYFIKTSKKMNIIVNTDGASRGNPGPAAYGFLIKDSNTGKILFKEGKTIGRKTNNVAEYMAVLKALEYIKESFGSLPHTIEVVTDSQLIASQLSGLYKVKNPNLRLLFDSIKSLEYELGQIFYRNVPREQNKEADKLANQALDSN